LFVVGADNNNKPFFSNWDYGQGDPNPLNTKRWICFAITSYPVIGGTNTDMFINGTKVTSNTMLIQTKKTGILNIGGLDEAEAIAADLRDHPAAPPGVKMKRRRLNGYMKDISVYNQVLQQDDIYYLCNHPR
jgi:hypothetical protein